MSSRVWHGIRTPRRLAAAGAVAVMTGAVAVTGIVTATTASAADGSTAVADIGWATQSGGTSGGSKATAALTYTVSTRSQLLAAIAGTNASTGKTNKTA